MYMPEMPRLLALIDRDLRDAQVLELSPDRRFATAYAAARGLAALDLGARASARGQENRPFTAPPTPVDPATASRRRYLERCRAKCWRIENLEAGRATEVEVEELLFELATWRAEVARTLNDSGPAPDGAGPHASHGGRSREA